MVEVFKTDVPTIQETIPIILAIKEKIPQSRATFDLDDCDHILRVELPMASQDLTRKIIQLVQYHGFEAVVLAD